MERIKYRISLDMFEVATQTTIKAKKGDTACSIYITLTENGKIYNITDGCYAVFSAKKPDGNYIFNSDTCSIEDNAIVYDFTEQTVPCEGVVECEVILFKDEQRLTSPRFNLVVDSTVYNGEEIVSTTSIDVFDQMMEEIKDRVIGEIGGNGSTDAVLYSQSQDLTDEQKEIARDNIDAISQAELDEAIANVGGGGKDGISATHSWNGTVLTVTSASGTSSADLKGEKGDPGTSGVYVGSGDMPDGYNVQIDLDGEAIEVLSSDEAREIIVEELAKRGQLKPEFANSIEECVDTSKLYVLPDGFIYAYMTKTVTKKPTNQIKASINSDGTQYVGTSGEDGYKTGYRLNSSGQEVALSKYACTGFIPCTVDDIIRTKNIEFEDTSNSQIHLYDASFASIVTVNCSSATSSLKSIMNDGNVEGSISQATTTLTESQKERIAYIRISASKLNDIAIVTLNESLESSTTTTQGWHSTGHAFVPGDYEDRIVDLEERMDELSAGNSNIPKYITEEVKRVADIVKEKQTVGSLTFTAMSDMHIRFNDSYWADNLTSCRDAGLGLAELQRLLRLDCAVMLGDYTVGGASDTIAQVKKDLTGVRNYMANGMKDIPNIWITGNHDINYGATSDRRMTEDELFAYLTNNNKCTLQDVDNIGRNYGYIDFENQKIRCIYLNTIDALDYPDNTDGTADDAMEITAIQAQWLVDVGLDFGNKSNPTEWGIVLLSHHCLCQFPPVTAILTAYKDGANGSTSITTNDVTTTVNYNFTSANRGEIICAVHGHDHNFTYRKISTERWDKVTEENAWLWSICIPNMDTARNNEKATSSDEAYKKVFGEFDANGDPVYYPKTQGTAKSTSFCVITIDRKNRKIHVTAYGAGHDREINYGKTGDV